VDGSENFVNAVVYLNKPVEVADFISAWHDIFGFSLDGRVSINPSTLEVQIQLTPSEANVIGNEPHVHFWGAKVLSFVEYLLCSFSCLSFLIHCVE
jgi:hypothetical protein